MEKIIKILEEETNSLKVQYIEMTKNWAEKEFLRILSIKEIDLINRKGWKNRSGVMEHTKASLACWDKINRLVKKGEANFIQEAIINAENHYKNSILRLADRINKKELNIENLKIETSRIGVNIEAIFTDGIKIVKAFTVIAGGEIQKPHYRYWVN